VFPVKNGEQEDIYEFSQSARYFCNCCNAKVQPENINWYFCTSLRWWSILKECMFSIFWPLNKRIRNMGEC